MCFIGGGLYCEVGSVYLIMIDEGILVDVFIYNLFIEVFGCGGFFDDVIEFSWDMEEVCCLFNRYIYEVLMGVYCIVGLFDEVKV